MRIYVSGPMNGYPLDNFPAFAAACDVLRGLGHDVLSPHEIQHGDGPHTHSTYLKRDLAEMLAFADAIVLLPGWPKSVGAKAELLTAITSGFRVFYLHEGALIDMEWRGE